MKHILLILLLLSCWVPSGYLIEYTINNIEYRLWYELSTDQVRFMNPIEKYIFVPAQVKKHWIDLEQDWEREHKNKNFNVTLFGDTGGLCT